VAFERFSQRPAREVLRRRAKFCKRMLEYSSSPSSECLTANFSVDDGTNWPAFADFLIGAGVNF
jgi:hypothetical protein